MKNDKCNENSISLKLTEQQLWRGLYVGALRRCSGIMHKKIFADQKGSESEIYMNDAIGAVAECAFQIRTGLEWHNTDYRNSRSDVGGYQVRSTYWPNGRLLYHLKDHGKEYPEDVYVFVTCFRLPIVVFRGWALGQEVLDHNDIQELQPGRPVYTLPQIYLHDMKTLPKPETLTKPCLENKSKPQDIDYISERIA